VATPSASAHATWSVIRSTSLRTLLRELKEAVGKNRLLLYASALAYRLVVSLIPLVLLALAVLGALGLRSTWDNSIKPAVDPHVQKPVATAINYTVEQILSGDSAGLIVFASLLVLWNVTLGVVAVMEALNDIHDVREGRTLLRRAVTAVGLAAVAGVLLIAALLVMSAAPLVREPWHTVFGIGRWLVAPALLAVAVGVLFRFAPAERPETEWASAGSALVIVVWLAASGVFVWWVTVAHYKSATGNLTFLLTIMLYVFITSSIFLLGAQLDELLRKKSGGRRAG
jgi:membrane protein